MVLIQPWRYTKTILDTLATHSGHGAYGAYEAYGFQLRREPFWTIVHNSFQKTCRFASAQEFPVRNGRRLQQKHFGQFLSIFWTPLPKSILLILLILPIIPMLCFPGSRSMDYMDYYGLYVTVQPPVPMLCFSGP